MRTDFLALALLIILMGIFAWQAVDFGAPPSEDAAILMRYADHVAQGEGIVWNIGEAPVDGATDFLFMLIVAMLHRFGLSLEAAVRLSTVASHFGTVILIYLGMRRVQGSGVVPAILSAAYFAVGPGLFISASYFGTPFFTLAVAAAWLMALKIILSHGGSVRDYIYFSLICLVVGLIRPEGVLISIFMLIAIGIIPLAEFRRTAFVFGAVFVILGGAFFVWHWSYFGHPLPNPFYVKGGGQLYPSSLVRSVFNNFRMLFPFIPAFLLSVRSTKVSRLGIAFLIPIACSALMWIFLSDEMNLYGRFQYPLLSVAALSWYPLVRSIREDLDLPSLQKLHFKSRLSIAMASVSVVLLIFAVHIRNSSKIIFTDDGRYDVGVMLSEYVDRGYTIVTTEAGLLPLYSKWRAVDAWGLNDQWIAHNGTITNEYLRSRDPDLIMWHGYFSPLQPPSAGAQDRWSRMVMTLFEFARRHDYELAAVFGVSPGETHYYYVRADLPESAEIIEKIRNTEYIWYKSGERCYDYSGLNPF
jgi:arabinofuranosyltransferase